MAWARTSALNGEGTTLRGRWRSSEPLPYPQLVTLFLQHFEIPLNSEPFVQVKRSFAIGSSVVTSFGYRKDMDGQWLKKDAQPPQDEQLLDQLGPGGLVLDQHNGRLEQALLLAHGTLQRRVLEPAAEQTEEKEVLVLHAPGCAHRVRGMRALLRRDIRSSVFVWRRLEIRSIAIQPLRA